MYQEVTEGQVLAGKYRVERVLGEGGMGVVVAARHLQLDERVALKFMRPEALVNAEAVARFAREAREAVKIKSEHVARVTDVGTLENGAPYMVMEYLDGGDLSTWLEQHGRLPVEQVVEFVLQASEALAEAHALGIVHRDLKPANLFVVRRPDGAWSVKVIDFGISKMTGGGSFGANPGMTKTDLSMTKTSAVMGSPQYMSPEQMRSVKDVDPRSDVWALGVVMYELVAGVTPFAADTFPELVLKIASDAPAPLASRAPDVPPGLERVIHKCLEKDPDRRFASIGELAVALVEFAPRRGQLSVERISGVLKGAGMWVGARALSQDSIALVDPGTVASWEKIAPSRSGQKRALLAILALLGLAGVAVGGYALKQGAVKAAASSDSTAPSEAPLASRLAPSVVPALAPAPMPEVSVAPVAAPPPPVSRPRAPKTAPRKAAGAASAPATVAKSTPTVTPSEPPAPPAPKPKAPAKTNIFDDR